MQLPHLLAPALAVVFLAPGLLAKDAEGSKEHADFKRITGAETIWQKNVEFGELHMALERIEWDYSKDAFKPTKIETAEGRLSTTYYKLPSDATTLEAVRQYEADLKPASFATLFTAENDKLDDGYGRFVTQIFPTAQKTEQINNLHEFNRDEQRYAILKGKGKAGNDVYISIFAIVLKDISVGFDKLVKDHGLAQGNVVVRVDILETKAMDARMSVVKSDEITSAIDSTGRVALYGVLFDTDKANLKPESADSISEIAKAITSSKGTFLIVGHTDNQGDFTYNQGLSLKRATAVTAALVSQHGIAADRVVPVGVGMAAPLAPNTDDEGRAKNRRVEIVKM